MDIQENQLDQANTIQDNPQTSSQNQFSLNQLDEFLNLESLIKNYVAQIENLQTELKEKKELLQSAFESDAVYQEKDQKAKEASKERSAVKKEILKRPELAETQERIKEIKFEIAESNAILSDYLQQYRQQTGANQIDLGNGEVMEIVTVTKIVRKPALKEE